MNWGDWLTTILVSLIAGSVPGLVAYFVNRKKNEADTDKVKAETSKGKAETELIHAQVADRWAEHVNELMGKVQKLEEQGEIDKAEIKGLRIDISQVRRENEEYRSENYDLKDWLERLLEQFKKHVPHVQPERFIHHPRSAEPWVPHTAE